MEQEIWKQIGNSTEYQISSYGRVKSFVRNKEGLIITPDVAKKGYKRVMLRYPEARTRHLVHRLVAKAFIVNEHNKCCVNHIDNNPSNNLIGNLEWCTYSENLIHAEVQGRLKETHKKAALASSISSRARKLERIASWKGKKFHKLKVIGLDRIEEFKGSASQYYINCKCDCGELVVTRSSNILGENVKSCKSCKILSTKKKNHLKLTFTKLTKFKHYIIKDFSDFDENVEKKNIIVTLECIKCNHISTKKYAQIRKKDRPHTCKNCGLGSK